MKIKSLKEQRFQIILTVLMVVLMLLVVYPVWFSIINSLENAQEISRSGYSLFFPHQLSFDSWKAVLNNPDIVNAFLITLSRTIIVTILQTLFTAMFAYGFSRNNLVGKRFYTTLGFISMYLNGGVIAYFILFNAFHIYNTYWVYIIPCLFGGFYNVIIFNANFKAIPDSLYESAKIDGASEYKIFFSIVIPLSKPVISALGIFTAVGTWNDYTQTLYYTKSSNLQTLSYYTLSITKSSESAAKLGENMNTAATSILTTMAKSASNYKTIELSCMVLSAIPLIVLYPFAQKFFEKGVMVGSVKG
ncbi:putative aldouronate transport system permease protein [Butyrivibrio proteoclasticus]|uniref:Putative aldouronate transport system permease protein n=1 Tax=Butyrivibrio proteoclasticus TaxID=43305 RepID=A0A1I5S558_9FIRM|nr:carbohydrate ABC transporter permease [Butyrivibrio proteoclasticus]SFP65908.1 putative aldouronate transport system permease protein [Butyrivibrio proteoclasticus]